MKARWERPCWTRLAGIGLAIFLGACGDGGSVTTPPTPAPPTPPPPTPVPPQILAQGEDDNIGKGFYKAADVETKQTGTVNITINYQYDDSQILVWLTDRPCTHWQFERDECGYIVRSVDERTRPRRLSASGVKAGGYTLFVANDGPNMEKVGYLVTLTPDATGSAQPSLGRPVLSPRP